MPKIQKQISALYTSAVLGNLSLTGAWVAILTARGFRLVEIGIAETVFHITSLLFELPSGIMADVFGRKRMLVVSALMQLMGNLVMMFSRGLVSVCISMSFTALSYNFSSGTGDALAYDSLKSAGLEGRYEKFQSNLMTIYRLCGGLSTLCAGFALALGYKIAYGTGLVSQAMQICVLLTLREVMPDRPRQTEPILSKFLACIRESLGFLHTARKALCIMFCNSLVGALDTVLLFFLQAKLPARGIPRQELGAALLLMELGGVVGARLILHLPRWGYPSVFLTAAALVTAGFLAEHSVAYPVMVLGGFLSALGDDALQVRTNALLQGMFPSQQRATLTSVESFTFSVIMVVLSPLAGILFSYW